MSSYAYKPRINLLLYCTSGCPQLGHGLTGNCISESIKNVVSRGGAAGAGRGRLAALLGPAGSEGFCTGANAGDQRLVLYTTGLADRGLYELWRAEILPFVLQFESVQQLVQEGEVTVKHYGRAG